MTNPVTVKEWYQCIANCGGDFLELSRLISENGENNEFKDALAEYHKEETTKHKKQTEGQDAQNSNPSTSVNSLMDALIKHDDSKVKIWLQENREKFQLSKHTPLFLTLLQSPELQNLDWPDLLKNTTLEREVYYIYLKDNSETLLTWCAQYNPSLMKFFVEKFVSETRELKENLEKSKSSHLKVPFEKVGILENSKEKQAGDLWQQHISLMSRRLALKNNRGKNALELAVHSSKHSVEILNKLLNITSYFSEETKQEMYKGLSSTQIKKISYPVYCENKLTHLLKELQHKKEVFEKLSNSEDQFSPYNPLAETYKELESLLSTYKNSPRLQEHMKTLCTQWLEVVQKPSLVLAAHREWKEFVVKVILCLLLVGFYFVYTDKDVTSTARSLLKQSERTTTKMLNFFREEKSEVEQVQNSHSVQNPHPALAEITIQIPLSG